jgi:AcrR family transcriptional regulator
MKGRSGTSRAAGRARALQAGAPEGARSREPRSTKKRRAIVEAARALFLRKGYVATSMDEIAADAGVSKQTVYSHFADKEGLFTQIVTAAVKEAADAVHAETLKLKESGDLHADLRKLARRQLALVMKPQILQLRRLAIAEADRFPDIGRAFYEQGPARAIASIAAAFERLAARGELRFEDARLAAAQFNWLVMSIPLNIVMFLGERALPSARDLTRFADAGVAAFLAAYGDRQ